MNGRSLSTSANPKSAILIIDMLNFFANEGDSGYRSRFDEVVKSIVELRNLADAAHVPLIYINTEFDSAEHFFSTAMARKSELHWLKGSTEALVIPQLAPRHMDYVVPKTVNSGFYGTALDTTLISLEVSRVFLTGVHTHVCVTLTAADAFYRNYDVVVVEECVTTIDLTKHAFGLSYIQRHLGRVQSLADGIGLFQ